MLRSTIASALLLSTLALSPASASASRSPGFLATGELLAARPVPDDAAAIAIAREALAAHFPETLRVALVARAVDLRDDGARLVAFDQQVAGVPVLDRGARVLVDPDGVPRLASANVDDRTPNALRPTIDATAAARAAGLSWHFEPSAARLVLVSLPSALTLAWELVANVPAEIPVRPLARVDATSGALLSRGDLARDAKRVRAFESNPAVSSLGTFTLTSLPDAPKSLATGTWVAKSCVDRKKVRTLTGLGEPVSAHVCDLEHVAVPDASFDFLYLRPASDTAVDDPLAETSAAWHVDRALRWFSSIGLSRLRSEARPLLVNVNVRMPPGWTSGPKSKLACTTCALEPLSNAFFAPMPESIGTLLFDVKNDAIFLGQGTARDFAYDGDVVVHELGHAVIHTVTLLGFELHLDRQGAFLAGGAVHEALADYFASALTGDGRVGEYAGGGKAIRDLDEVHTCPERLSNESHHDSLPLSGALWKTRQALPDAERAKLDRGVLLGLEMLPSGDVGFDDVAASIVKSVEKEASPEIAKLLAAAFSKHGVSGCRRVLELPGGGTSSAPFGFIAYGDDRVSAPLHAGVVPGVAQFHRKLPSGTSRVRVQFTGQTLPQGPPWLGEPTPWTPVLLLKHGGAPIAFAHGATGFRGDHHVQRDLVEDSAWSEEIAVPEGTTDVWVMIATRGEGAGVYDDVTVDPVTGPPPDAGPIDVGPVDTGAPSDAATDAADGGFDPSADRVPIDVLNGRACACRTPSTAQAPSSWAFAPIALALLALRRRR